MLRPPTGMVLRWMSPLALILLTGPVAAGVLGTLLPALGYFPALGGTTFSIEPWRALWELPGLWTSVRLSLSTGVITTAVSLVVVIAFCAAWHGTCWFRLGERILAPLLSVPHAAVAFGIAFLVAPSGWLVRLLSPWATGFDRPPDWLTTQDPYGISLMLGLIVKEVPFLMIMTLAALGQADAERSRTVALTLGYGTMSGWLKAVFPRVYPQIRLPVLAVLAYTISVVDVAIILGPTTPAPLAVRLVRLFNDSDLNLRFVASAGACLQCGLVVIGIALWCGGEAVARWAGTRWIVAGNRNHQDHVVRVIAAVIMGVSAGAAVVGLISMGLWSFAATWWFPAAWPNGLTLMNWTRHLGGLATPLVTTLAVATCAAALAVLLAVGVLEDEARSGRRRWITSSKMIYAPLLLPQVAFLFGAQILLVAVGFDGRWPALTWVHLVFVFPYVWLSLSDAYRAWDDRYQRTGWCLGASTLTVFLQIKLPMLLRAIATAVAVGFAVSVGLYLPTLLAGGGRYSTITTEAVTLSAGGDFRLIGIYTLMQMLLPFLGFTTAGLLTAWRFRHYRGMRVS